MSGPPGLDSIEAATMAAKFGVALDQVHRDYLISLVLWALQDHTDDLIFFGGTALARTHLTDGRLSEDIDLMAVHDRSAVAKAISRTIDRALRVAHGRVTWSVPLVDIRDVDPATLRTDDGMSVRIQLLKAEGYAPWPTVLQDITQRYSDVPPTRLRTPTRDAFAAWKTAAWFDRRAPRDLYDLWQLAKLGAMTRSAADLFAEHAGMGLPQDHMFSAAPTPKQWQEELAGQTRLTVTPEEALEVVRSAWSAVSRR